MLEDPELNGVGAPTCYLPLWILMWNILQGPHGSPIWMYKHEETRSTTIVSKLSTNPIGLSVYQSSMEFYKLRRHLQKIYEGNGCLETNQKGHC